VPIGTFLRGAGLFVVFGFGLFVMQVLWNKHGVSVLILGPLRVTSGGVDYGLQKWLMAGTFGLASFIYIWTTSPRETVVGLVRLGVPYRLAWGLFLMLRYVPLFENEVRIIREAQQIRGIRRGAGLRGYLDMYRRYTIPLLVSMVRKGTQLAISMDGRAFGAYPTRTFRDDFRWSRSGIALMALVALGIAGALFIYGVPFVPKNPAASPA
jgi:energy-coupling factor transport system permease protein